MKAADFAWLRHTMCRQRSPKRADEVCSILLRVVSLPRRSGPSRWSRSRTSHRHELMPNVNRRLSKASSLGAFGPGLLCRCSRDNELIGMIVIYRQEVRQFTDKQIELVKNFAAQAVIAIENTRLLNELRESLQQQTATADVLQVISSSPGELEPVFHAMLENATRVCGSNFGTLYLREGEAFRAVSMHGATPDYLQSRLGQLVHPGPGTGLGRAVRTKQAVHIADLTAE